ncbi:uncharacterized protein LOC135609055 [Musa acuminata AAA Group]|uniref:(wild Malaysian banana) hypothetical protein n=1 Tax=Musa acuminata subsp. malaccensis TaxID=214687 RepID=A0A804IQD2_MUSAM|nr:PREDICTED: uncharacterized protein LOC103974456 [Musa acuminata subsp. malaccensis]CAG1842506.1 unnamed protein product [Musa acuminata subsp. malaccensis]
MPKHFTYSLLVKLRHPPSPFPSLSKMKKAVSFLKQIGTVLAALLKAKTLGVKSKARLMFFDLLRNKKLLMSAISGKIQALKGQVKGGHGGEGYGKAIVMYDAAREEVPPSPGLMEPLEYVEEEDYSDLTHCLFDIDEDDSTSSVVDLVPSPRDDGLYFNIEDEIDHVADVFIRRFRREMRLQMQDSPRRYQEMFDTST